VKKRQPSRQDDRRRSQVEINLIGEDEPGTRGPLAGRRRGGCTLPFLGGSVLILVCEAVRLAAG
jgi:hypothetical protein